MTLMSGTMISQVIALFLSPILTRIYTPEDYGLLGVYASVVSIISVIGSLKYDAALLLPKKDTNALKLYQICYRILLVLVSVIFLLLILFYNQFLEFLNASSLGVFILLSGVSILFLGSFHINNNLLNRFKRYRGLAVTKVSRTTGTSFGQLGFGIMGVGFTGLIFGRLVGEGLGMFFSRFYLAKTPRFKNAKNDISESDSYLELAKRYKDFPKITAPHALTNASASSLPTLILITFFNSSVVGWFNQCIKVIFLPITLISASTYQVFSQKVTELHNDDKSVRKVTTDTLKKLALIGALPFSFLLFFAPDAFAFVFSEQWRVAGEFAQLLVPNFFMVFIVSPLAYLPILFGQQAKSFKIEIIYLVLRLSAIFVGVYYNDPYIAIGLYGFVSFCTLNYVLLWYLRLANTEL